MENCSQKQLDDMCHAVLPIIKTKLFEGSLCRQAFPTTFIKDKKIYLPHDLHEIYSFDVKKRKRFIVSGGSPVVPQDLWTMEQISFYDFDIETFSETINLLIDKLISAENKAFINFIKSFCEEEIKTFSFSDNDYIYFSRKKNFFYKNGAKTITSNDLEKFEILSIDKGIDVKVFSGDVLVKGYMSQVDSSIILNMGINNFALAMAKDKYANIRRMKIPEMVEFTAYETTGSTIINEKSLSKITIPPLFIPGITISQEELIFQATMTNDLFLDME